VSGTLDVSGVDVDQLDDAAVMDLLAAMYAAEDAERFGKFAALFPDMGDRARDLYPRHLDFFKAGATYRERCFMAANQVGKTTAGGYEASCHLTGNYPHWWPGRRFRHPIRMWAAGDYNETTRDIVQKELLGEVSFAETGRKGVDGSGLIPRECIVQNSGNLTWKQGVADLIDTVKIKHVSGGLSTLGLKSYMQGRKSFQGTRQHVIWFDEEPPMDVYNEALIRTATTGGLTMLTFTPLSGMSEVVLGFLPQDMRPDAA
jgi:phage terminase large subunit-like protein